MANKLVQSEILKNTKTFSYDRAGLGNSDTGDLPRTSLDQVHELHTVLNRAKVKAPYIIVAHSIAGYNARLFAGTYPYQNDLVSLSDYSKHIIIEDSSHYIQKDHPQVVIDEIKGMINGMSK
jgi:pimeloyl-ACP methyl ester carboxylesterase